MMRIIRTGDPCPICGRPVTAEDQETLDRWTLYASIKDAARIVGVNPAQISTACVTGNKCAGMRWEREEKR